MSAQPNEPSTRPFADFLAAVARVNTSLPDHPPTRTERVERVVNRTGYELGRSARWVWDWLWLFGVGVREGWQGDEE